MSGPAAEHCWSWEMGLGSRLCYRRLFRGLNPSCPGKTNTFFITLPPCCLAKLSGERGHL